MKPDLMGIIDIASGILLYFTVSPVPSLFADSHAYFLIFKGVISHFNLGQPVIPIFTLGIAADIISAAILILGNPPLVGNFKYVLAGALLIKGLWSLSFKLM